MMIIGTQGLHLAIPDWLKRLELDQYATTFEQFNGVEELIHFCEPDLHKLGVKNAAHRARMASSLVALRDRKGTYTNCFSLARSYKVSNASQFSLSFKIFKI